MEVIGLFEQKIIFTKNYVPRNKGLLVGWIIAPISLVFVTLAYENAKRWCFWIKFIMHGVPSLGVTLPLKMQINFIVGKFIATVRLKNIDFLIKPTINNFLKK